MILFFKGRLATLPRGELCVSLGGSVWQPIAHVVLAGNCNDVLAYIIKRSDINFILHV